MLTVFTTDLSTNIIFNSLDCLVPRLDGTNYQKWSFTMQSYLMAQGQWLVVVDSPVVLSAAGSGHTTGHELTNNRS